MNRLVPICLALFLPAAAASGQRFFMPTDTPTTGTCNVYPFGVTSFRYQCIASNADLGQAVVLDITDLAFTPCMGAGVIHFDTIEIVLAQSNSQTLSTTFSANLMQNPQVVLKATNYDWHVTANQWNRIGLDKRYLYIQAQHPYLVIEITGTGVTRTGVSTTFHRDSTHQRVYALNWTGTPPATGTTDGSTNAALKFEVSAGASDVNAFGVACAGSSGTPALTVSGDGKIGGTFGVSVTNCRASAVVGQVFGLTRFEPRVDLGLIGAQGCFLYQSVDVIAVGVASTAGVFAFNTSVPQDNSLRGAKVYTQAAPADAQANNWGSTTSNYARLLVGI